MKLSKALIIFSAAVLLSGCTIKTTENNKRTVSVTGTGTVEVEPDHATITLAVITRGKDVSIAATDNANKMNKVYESIIALNIEKDCIKTENFDVHQEMNYINGREVPGDYKATNRIRILVKDLTMVSNVIDTALKNGANQLSDCSYGITDSDIYVKQARTLAVQNAAEAANLIATTSGAMLGKVLSINEQFNSSFSKGKTVSARASLMAVNDSTPVSAGKTSISFTVDATYELR